MDMKQLYARADESIAEIAKNLDVTCTKGCHWCCHQLVFVTLPEAQLIHDSLDLNIDIARILANQATFSQHDWANRPHRERKCVFLVDRECSIYDIRPLACRNYLVTSNVKYCHYDSRVKKVLIARSQKVTLETAKLVLMSGLTSLPTALAWLSGIPIRHTDVTMSRNKDFLKPVK
jgi:Fe-S-cluster containining protein